MINYQNITLDVNNSMEYQYIYAKQGDDNARFLRIQLTENGNGIVPGNACNAVFRCLKPDGRICFNHTVINDDGSISVCLTKQVLAAKGTVRADISLLEGDTVLSAATFFIQVEAAPILEGGVLSTDEFLALTEKMEEVKELKKDVEQTLSDVESAENGLTALHSRIENTDRNVAAVQLKTEEIKTDMNRAENSISDIKSYIGYAENDILGLCVDYENNQFTRLAGAAGKSAGPDFDVFNMYGGRRRCTVKADGTVKAFFGENDYNPHDISVQTMVYQPKFYYRVVPLKTDKIENGIGYHIRKANYYVSDTPKAGFKLHPAFYDENGKEIEYILYSAFEGAYAVHYFSEAQQAELFNDAAGISSEINMEEDCILSVSGAKPVTGMQKTLTRQNAETLCRNFGVGWHCETIKTLSANQLLMMIEYGTMNLQNAIGKGIVNADNVSGKNCAGYTGATNTLGNETGTAEETSFKTDSSTPEIHYSENGKTAVSYRGIENPWGNIWKWTQGINLGKSMSSGQSMVYAADDFDFKENCYDENYRFAGFTVQNQTVAGYISAMGYGNEEYDWMFMPTEINGNSNLPVGDNCYLGSSGVLRSGAHWAENTGAGAFCTSYRYSATYKSVATGCRTVYIPTAE